MVSSSRAVVSNSELMRLEADEKLIFVVNKNSDARVCDLSLQREKF